MNKRYLVTGAAGLIGFELTAQLLAEGKEVIALDVFLKGGEQDLIGLAKQYPKQLQWFRADLTNPDSFKNIQGPFEAIFHFAAIVGVRYVNEHPYETSRVNLLSTIHVLDFANRVGCGAFVFASSSENYASAVEKGWVPLPSPEEVPLCIGDIRLPRWSYAASKLAGEAAVLGAASEFGRFRPVVIRFHNVYGLRMGPTHVIPEFLDRAQQRVDPFPIYGFDATRSFLYVEDAIRGVRLAQEKGSTTPIFNVGSPIEVSIGDLVEKVFEVSGYHPKIQKFPAPPGSVTRRVPDISKLLKLGFSPRISLKEGLQRCWKSRTDPMHKKPLEGKASCSTQK